MRSPPKISVLVPVFNGEKYLAECLDSVLAQDFSDYELLISEDCSSDGTVAVIERYAASDPRIRWWHNPVNLGPVANLNFCLRQARGEFIKFVFADDKLLAPSALHQMVQVLAGDPTIALVGSASHVLTAGGRVLQVRDFFRDTRRQPGMKLLMQCLEQSVNLISEPTTVMFRREQAARGFDERFRRLPDLELWFHLLEQGDFAYIAEPLSAFRRHAAQETEVVRRSGAYQGEEILLKKIYYPRAWERRAVTGLALVHLIRHLRKSPDGRLADLAATILRTFGRGRYIRGWIHYRARRLFRKLFFPRGKTPAVGKPLLEVLPSIPTISGRDDNPLISVLIPVYNGEKYLAECLDSVLAQDFADMEILIADDGSTDGSLELIQCYAERDRRIRWWRNPVNLGLAGNFNGCLRAAHGKYIKYVLQDDLLLAPLALWRMAEILNHHPRIMLVGSASNIIAASSGLIKVRDHFRETCWWAGQDLLVHCLVEPANLIGEPTTVMFRREGAARGFDEQFRQLVDLEFWLHLLEQGDFAYLAEPLSAFRQHAAQMTQINRSNGVDIHDDILLRKIYYPRVLERRTVSRRLLFNQIRRLRKSTEPSAVELKMTITQTLGWSWFAYYWVEYKISKPFKNLDRWLRKKFPARIQNPAAV
jgi:glycosyltransferase involved in cell wall biosynthesis